MKKPDISVVMSSYNHEKFVEEAIRSVLAQKNVDFEFLIADDGSSDNTAGIIQSIQDPRIRFIPRQKNIGACASVNELLQQAEGEFIAKINSDDRWVGDDKLSFQLNILRENPELAACFGHAGFIDAQGKGIPDEKRKNPNIFKQPNRSQGKWLRYFFDKQNCLCHPTILIRKSYYDTLGLYNNCYRQLPDYDFWVRLLKHAPIHISDRVMIEFRLLGDANASSGTSINVIRTMNEHRLIMENFFDDINPALLAEGFSDLMVHPEKMTPQHVEIEKALLYFTPNTNFAHIYLANGLRKMKSLLDNPEYQSILINDYGIDFYWFQEKTAKLFSAAPRLTVAHHPLSLRTRITRKLKRILGLNNDTIR